MSSWQAGCLWGQCCGDTAELSPQVLRSLCSFISIIMMTVHTWLKLSVVANYSVKHGHISLASTIPHVWILISGYVHQWHYYWQHYHGMNNSGIAVDSIITATFAGVRCMSRPSKSGGTVAANLVLGPHSWNYSITMATTNLQVLAVKYQGKSGVKRQCQWTFSCWYYGQCIDQDILCSSHFCTLQ